MTDRALVKMVTWLPTTSGHLAAIFRASASVLKLLECLPVATDMLLLAQLLDFRKIPVLPSNTGLIADISVY